MLKLLRKKGVMKKVIWSVVVVIIIAFGLGGTLYLLDDTPESYAGKIFGKKISFDDYEKAYRDVRIQAILRYGDKFRDIQQFLNLETETWDRLILTKEVNKRKIKVSDQEVVEQIQQYPFFQREGQFDELLYNEILSYAFRISARKFEESIRDKIKFEKLYVQKTTSVDISNEAVFAAYKHQNEKVQISYAFIDPNDFKNQVPFDEEKVKEYYNNNRIEFLLPPSINISYVQLDFPPVPAVEKEASDETIEQEPSIPEINQEAKEKVRQHTDEIYQELLVSSNLESVAKKYNLPIKTSGLFSMEKPNLALGWSYELLNQIFSMDINDITEPIETTSGYQIAQIKEKKESYVPEYLEAREKAREIVLNKEANIIAEKKSKDYLDSLYKELAKTKLRDFPKSAKTLGLNITQTPAFTRGQYLPKIGISKEFQDAAFELNDENSVSDVIVVENGFCILHLDNYIPVENADFEKNKERIAETLLNEERQKVFNIFLSTLKAKAKLEDNIAKMRAEKTGN
ncbi:hypothetical protein MNBD_UNCLBAC01-941 [hydrothermal vent metagenome]|uniref:Periplasmic chaperone PpiD n=1 Tax=hydrothermal vent metagenome TaxID=652676 RepID=A0A3B1DTK9_9ZZZZ